MISLALTSLALVASDPAIPANATRQRIEPKTCREMFRTSSRARSIMVCKTKAEWRRWQDCHGSVTRYCTPVRKTFVINDQSAGSRIVCKDFKTTGTRVRMERVCAPMRDWELAQRQTEEDLRNRQNGSLLRSE